MKNNTLHQMITSLSLTLCLTAMLGTGEAQEQVKPNSGQGPAPVKLTEAKQAKSAKKQSKKAKARGDKNLIAQLKSGQGTPEEYAEWLARDSSRIAATVDHPSDLGITIMKALKSMSREKLSNQILPALEKQFLEMLSREFEPSEIVSQVSKSTANKVIIEGSYVNMINALAAIGPDAHPVLAKGLGYNPAVDMFITRKLGEKAKAAVQGLLENPTNAEWYWLGYYAAVLAKPGKASVPVLLRKMKEDDRDYGKYIRMVLDSIGAEAVPQVVAALKDSDWFARFSAARTFEMMGPKARAALPALEKSFNDTAEDIDVRVAAARAIARIKGIDEASLYKKIPNLKSKLIESTQEKSLAWRKKYLKREGKVSGKELVGWPQSAWLVAAMVSGENIDAANDVLLEMLKERKEGFGSADADYIHIFVTCHSKAAKYPGRLKPETEAAFKKFYFALLDRELRTTGKATHVGAEFLNEWVSSGANLMRFNDDLPLDEYIRDYLALSVLKDDPVYRDKTLTGGDTVRERYNAFTRFYREAIRHWALCGIQYQLGSCAYTYKTYPHYFNLLEHAPDPIIRKRAKMYIDIIMMESEQISISGVRGSTKGRSKRGGLGDRWDPYRALLFGERGSAFFLMMPADSSYQVPEPALYMRKLGKPVKTYEIINDRCTSGAERKFPKDSKAINYAWNTPEYVSGCGIYDPNENVIGPTMGRWDGVIFRNLAAISLNAYTGEKWNAQHKDVRITQMCSDGPYVPGIPRIAFEALNGKVSEKDGWVFVNNDEAYGAVKVVSGGYYWIDSINRLLYLNDVYSPIIVQTGRAQDYGSFEKFQAAILNAPLTHENNKVEYHGPNSAKIEFFPMTPARLQAGEAYTLPTVNGKTIDLNPEYGYYSPYMQRKEGSDIITLIYGDRKWEYHFKNSTVTEKTTD